MRHLGLEQASIMFVRMSFSIKYYIPDRPRKNEKLWILYQFKCTTVNLHRICPLDTSSFQFDVARSCGAILNLDLMKDVISLLQINPTMSANELRPFIVRHVQPHKSLSAQYIYDFSKKVIKSISVHGVERISTH